MGGAVQKISNELLNVVFDLANEQSLQGVSIFIIITTFFFFFFVPLLSGSYY